MVKEAVVFTQAILSAGCVDIDGNAFTVKVATEEVIGPQGEVTTIRYWLLFIVVVTADSVRLLVVAPAMSVNVVPPFVLTCHWYPEIVPVVVITKVASAPAHFVVLTGCAVMPASTTVNVTTDEVRLPQLLVTIARYLLLF